MPFLESASPEKRERKALARIKVKVKVYFFTAREPIRNTKTDHLLKMKVRRLVTE